MNPIGYARSRDYWPRFNCGTRIGLAVIFPLFLAFRGQHLGRCVVGTFARLPHRHNAHGALAGVSGDSPHCDVWPDLRSFTRGANAGYAIVHRDWHHCSQCWPALFYSLPMARAGRFPPCLLTW